MDAVKTYSWRCIYAKTDGEFNYHLNTMINECKAKGYDAYKDWCEKEAARCWAAQQELVAMTMQN